MALNLFGRANRLTRANFVDAGERLGLRPRAIVAMIDALVDGASPWPAQCDRIGFDDKKTHLLEQMLRQRIDSLKGV